MVWLKAWWSQPDQFDNITDFLRQRDLMRSARMIMAVVSSASGSIPLTVLASQRHYSIGSLLIGVIGVVFTAGMVLFWLTRWPTRWQSRAAVVAGAVCVALWTVMQASAPIATLGCTAMTVTGGYIAVFHSGRVMILNSVLTVAITAVTTVALARSSGAAAAAAGFGLIFLLNVSAPLTIRALSRALVLYAQRSEEDPLTGLLNRRGFIDAVTRRVSVPPRTHTHLTVLMLDLDNFKRVNDTYGHAVGDRTLLDVAGVLKLRCPPAAVICRAGGEEFLVAVTATAEAVEVTAMAKDLCEGISDLPYQVTASIGTASIPLPELTGPDAAQRISRLTEIADEAMYTAKQCGGNQVRHA
ncbi:GGDEF domain-containing protein [Mycolicibacterium sp. S2-37]|uniref:GGDEF domain-containing protein n=1 Tax=Mycolicibacterium sp. S2-37 TaxID=2810297 RepID=UPI001A951A24|nr:GGDEF domain-containing protein [Mycolicibacterium sp. S2-37]MBO0676153.1 GGDEF domain-containing protein [Mycolicibacterium sp. S2-37]